MFDNLSPIFYLVVLQSCKAGLVISAILVFHALAGKRLSPVTRHATWLLVPLSLLLCVSVPSPLSVWNAARSWELGVRSEKLNETEMLNQYEPEMKYSAIPGLRTESLESSVVVSSQNSATCEMQGTVANTVQGTASGNEVSVANGVTGSEREKPKTGHSVRSLCDLSAFPAAVSWLQATVAFSAAVTWIIGCLVMAIVFLWQILMCHGWLKRGRPITSERVLLIFSQCVRRMNVRTWLVVAESSAVSGPFLMGVLRPTLLLPEKMVRDATDEQLLTVFLHELAHLKRWDIWTSWLMTCLLIVHWFNPLLWLAVRRMNADREEACDALALARLDPGQRKNYGISLVDITAQFQSPARTPGLAGISEDGKILTRRIEMIRQTGTWKPRWTLLAALFALLLGAVTLTDAQQPSKPGNIVVNGVEYTPVVKEEVPQMEEPSIQQLEINPKWAAILGNYWSTQDDRQIRLIIQLATKKVPLEQMMPRRAVVLWPKGSYGLSLYFQVMFHYQNGIYTGELKSVDDDKLTIELTQYFVTNKEEKPVPEALQNMTLTVIRDGDNHIIALDIPKSEAWDAIRLKKDSSFSSSITTLEAVPHGDFRSRKMLGPVGLPGEYDEPNVYPIVNPFTPFASVFTGSEGERKITFEFHWRHFSDGPQMKCAGDIELVTHSPCVRIYEGGFEGDWKSGEKERLFYADVKFINNNELEMRVAFSHDGINEKPAPDALKNLTARIIRDGDNISLEIPANGEWDAVKVTKVKEGSQQYPEQRLRTSPYQTNPGKTLAIYPIMYDSCEAAMKILKPLLPNVQFKQDRLTNSLVVLATSEEHELIKKTLDEWEQQTQNDEKKIIMAYIIKNADPETVLAVMKTVFAETPDVRLALDPKTNHLVVLCNKSVRDKVHDKVVEILKEMDRQEE
ncbi:MAG: hypothetical protein FWH27_13700 [Planctomycetaceae bacterium]|nr:hypothetical protein [Planctomycetaceae bacterium]